MLLILSGEKTPTRMKANNYALLMFGGNLHPTNTGDGIQMLGGYLHFSASNTKLRGEVDKLLSILNSEHSRSQG
ncbi:hypothetical protein ACS0TY_016101 [Phlomoides rotata]